MDVCKEGVIRVVWHEAVQGRNDEDVCSAFIKVLREPPYRDAKEVVEWADNCTGQMKNWTLYCALVQEVNNSNLSKITLKYSEKGHMFMSVDSFHALVEASMCEKKKLCDFRDFSHSIPQNGRAISISPDDFYAYKNKLSTGRDTHYPRLKYISVVQFRNGSGKMYWKEGHEHNDYQEGEFMQKKHRVSIMRGSRVPQKEGPLGVTASKKRDILKKIVSFLPKDRIEFWETLDESETSKDLTINYDHVKN